MSLHQSKYDWNYRTEKSEKSSKSLVNGCSMPRGKFIGGTGGLDSGVYLRGHSDDYDAWAKLGNTGWDYETVLGYFKKSEKNILFNNNYHGKDGLQPVNSFMSTEHMLYPFTEALHELDYGILEDINGEEFMGYTTLLGTLKNGVRQSAAKSFLTPALDRKNLHVMKLSQVTYLDFDHLGNVEKVNFIWNGTREMTVKAKKEVILTAGPINTPQILLMSGIGPEKHLNKKKIPLVKNLPVGRNLQDHAMVPLVFKIDEKHSLAVTKEELIDNLYVYISQKVGPFGNIGSNDFIGMVNTNESTSSYPDVQFQHFTFRKQAPELLFFIQVMGYEESVGQTIMEANYESNIAIVWNVLLRPKSIGKVVLRTSNAVDKPKIYTNYLNEQEDVNTLVRAIRHQQKFLDTDAFKQHEAELVRMKIRGCGEIEYDTDDYWECYVRHLTSSSNNPCGTTKMGPDSDKTAVVDPTLKVKGIKGLRVADASIMPQIISGHVNTAAVMIGEKAADLIKGDWPASKKKEL